MKKFGLIGYPLGHSFSQGYFTDKFKKESILECEYNNYPIESIDLLPAVIEENPELVGLNVTIPYKQEIFKYLDELDSDAEDIGAVNTIKITRNESQGGYRLKGFNTDVYGFQKPLQDVIEEHHKKALVLGTGGAAKAVCWVLENLGVEYRYVSRNPKRDIDYSYTDLPDEIVAQSTIIINTSPIGMYPNIADKPSINYDMVSSKHILYDLVYNPEETEFLKQGKIKKAITINGLPMLFLQAEKAWEIWNV